MQNNSLASRLKWVGLSVTLACTLLGTIGVGLCRAHPPNADFSTVFAVTNTNDAGPGSLRQALLDANGSPGADVISISATGTVNLSGSLPLISEAASLEGPGAALFRVDGQDLYRVFDIAGVAVSMSGLSLQRGNATGPSANGAAIRSSGDLTLSSVHVLSSTAGSSGGGLYVTGDLAIDNSLFRNNHSTGGNGGALRSCCAAVITATQFISNTSPDDGGAAYVLGSVLLKGTIFQDNRCTLSACDGGAVFSFSQTTLEDSIFAGNSAEDQGGGLAAPGHLNVTNSLFQDNQGWSGGGIYAQDAATIKKSQFLGNTAVGGGGAVYSFGILTTTGSLVKGNTTTSGGGGGLVAAGTVYISNTRFLSNTAQEGGGLYHGLWDATILNSLFAGNQTAGGGGAAMYLVSPGAVDVRHVTLAAQAGSVIPAIEVMTGTVDVSNSIVTGHAVGIRNAGGVVSQDFNLFFDNGVNTEGMISGGASSLTVDPLFISPAASDYRLSPGSPGIDMATNAGVHTDFEGDPRPLGSGFDIGFDEANYILGLALAYAPDPALAGAITTLTASVTSGAGISYTWDFGDGSPGATGNPTSHVYGMPDSYQVMVTATNPMGSVYTTTQVNVVAQPPAPYQLFLPFLSK